MVKPQKVQSDDVMQKTDQVYAATTSVEFCRRKRGNKIKKNSKWICNITGATRIAKRKSSFFYTIIHEDKTPEAPERIKSAINFCARFAHDIVHFTSDWTAL